MAIVGKPLPAWIDPLLWAVVPLPLLWASGRLLLGWGVDPGERLVHFLGLWSLHWLILTLAISPATWLLHWPHLVRLRRTLGLACLIYASLHLLGYGWFLLGWQFATLGDDLLKRPYIVVGFAAWLLLLPLGATSTRAMQRRLGRRWKTLHRLIYLIALLALLHLGWQVKADWSDFALYTLLLGGLLGARLLRWLRPPLTR